MMNWEYIVKRTYEHCTNSLLLFSLGLALILSFLGSKPYIEPQQLIPIFLLWVLFVVIKGLEESRFMHYFAQKIEQGSFLVQKMLLLGFFLSFFLSIDITLVILLPLTLLFNIKKKKELFVLVAFSTHLGAALTPFGTPQNLFIFSYYHIALKEFFSIIAPFSLTLFSTLFILSFFIKNEQSLKEQKAIVFNKQKAFLFTLLMLFSIAVTLHFLPWYLAIFTLLLAFFIEKKSLDIDYALLLTFLVFILLSNQIKELISPFIGEIQNPFWLMIALSQIISNVGATLLLHNFTHNYNHLLLASNIASFGTLIASFANLISYNIYIAKYKKEKRAFLFYFLRTNFTILALCIIYTIYFKWV